MQKLHAQLQEAHSSRQLELAKSTNIDKLVRWKVELSSISFVLNFCNAFITVYLKMRGFEK